MATPRRPYVSLRLGIFEDALNAGVSGASVLVLALLLTHRIKRSVPGLLQLGPAGLAESLRMPLVATRRAVTELEAAGLVLVDAEQCLLYCVGAIEADGPKTENSVRGMAAQVRDLPPSSIVTRAVQRAIVEALTAADKVATWLPIWREVRGPNAEPASDPDAGSGSGFGPGPAPNPGPGPAAGPHARGRVPRSEIRDPIAANQDPRSDSRNGHGRSPAARASVDAGAFDVFWNAYPRKTAKGAALKAWTALNPTPELQRTIADALAWQVARDDWLRDGGKYIPHPATWLHRQQWADERPAVTSLLSDIGRQNLANARIALARIQGRES